MYEEIVSCRDMLNTVLSEINPEQLYGCSGFICLLLVYRFCKVYSQYLHYKTPLIEKEFRLEGFFRRFQILKEVLARFLFAFV